MDTATQTVAPRPMPPPLCCAWCTPKAELERLSRAFPNTLSHGICPGCAAKFEGEGV